MTKGIAIDFGGDRELERAFRDLELKVGKKVVRSAMRPAMRPVLDAAKAKVPVLTGKLQRSLRMRALKARRGIFGVRVMTGTRDELGISESDKGFYPNSLEYGYMHSGGQRIAARPYMRPALSENAETVLTIFRQRVADGIKRAWDAAR